MSMSQIRVILLRTAGTNCDLETKFAFEYFGALVDAVHVKQVVSGQKKITDYHILVIPGGFSYGDDIASGRILANELKFHLQDDIARFIDQKKIILGICNGFQVLVKAGILAVGERDHLKGFSQNITLMHNDSGRFEDRWVYLKTISSKCVWTKNLSDKIYLPIAHGEGKFLCQQSTLLKQLNDNDQIVFKYINGDGSSPKYPNNPNGSLDHIAGMSDVSGRILGLMPHPERHFFLTQHPFWTRFKDKKKLGDGAAIFENGINYVKENL